MNRRWGQRWHAATAAVSLALWLLLTVAEAYPALHAWLHGGTIPDDDDCAIVAVAHGKVETVTCDAPAALPVTQVELPLREEAAVFSPVVVVLPDGRGPPVFFMVS